VLLYFTGGDGVRGGDPRGSWATDLSRIAERSGAIVVAAGYRLAPENPFPDAHDDAYALVSWVFQEAASIGGDPTRIALGGESFGATLAVATALRLVASSEPVPRFLLLVTPLLSPVPEGESAVDSADAKPVGRPELSWAAGYTFSRPEDAADQRVQLLRAPTLTGLPATLVLTAARDPLRSQGEDFALRLDEAGIPTEAVRYEGMPHGFFGLAAVVRSAAAAQDRAADAVKKTLSI
jgi:acetyl esterase/lipase